MRRRRKRWDGIEVMLREEYSTEQVSSQKEVDESRHRKMLSAKRDHSPRIKTWNLNIEERENDTGWKKRQRRGGGVLEGGGRGIRDFLNQWRMLS